MKADMLAILAASVVSSLGTAAPGVSAMESLGEFAGIAKFAASGGGLVGFIWVTWYLLTKHIPRMQTEHTTSLQYLATRHEEAVKKLTDEAAAERREHRQERREAIEAIDRQAKATDRLCEAVESLTSGGEK